jgi:tungstate transport system ATP-binding protein
MMSSLLEIRDLIVRRDKRQVLAIETLAVEKGEVLAIVGPNGTGKSSLLLTLARLLPPEKGELLWQGQPFNKQPALTYRRRIALVLQEPLLLDASVFENIAIGLRYRGLPSERITLIVSHWLKKLGIETLRDRPAAHLSGGEAQRVSLARAFVLNPELLLLDEPFSALDAPTRLRLLDDLKSILNETGTTAILITHDLKEAACLASRVAVMLNGQVVQVGNPEEVFANPANPAVAAFLGI